MEDDPTNRTPTPLDWAKDVNESIGISPISTDMKPTVHVENPTAEAPPAPTSLVTHGPCDLSALCLGTQNPWGTLSRHHHRHCRSQSPCNPSTPNSAKRATWNSACHPHRCFHPSPPPPHLAHSTPIYTVEMVHHPQGIAPTKPVIRTTSPVHHNAPRAPVRLILAIHPVDTPQDPHCRPFTPLHRPVPLWRRSTGSTGIRPLLGCSHIWSVVPMPTLEMFSTEDATGTVTFEEGGHVTGRSE